VDKAQSAIEKKSGALSLRDEAEIKKRMQQLQAKTEAKFLKFRSNLVILWVVSNGILVSVITHFDIAISFLTVLLYTIIFFNGSRLIGSVIYFFTHLSTRRLEQMEALKRRQELATALGQDPSKLKLKPLWMYPLEVLFRPFVPRTYFFILMESLVSPLLTVLALAWIAFTSIFSLVAFCQEEITISTFKSWRKLAKWEFELFSEDGFVARWLGIDSISRRRTARACMEVSLQTNSQVTVNQSQLL
jgi:hypothetical protein